MDDDPFDAYMDSLPAHQRKRVLAQIDNGGPEYLAPKQLTKPTLGAYQGVDLSYYQGPMLVIDNLSGYYQAAQSLAVVPWSGVPTRQVPKYRAVTNAVTYCCRACKPAARAGLRACIWALRALTNAALRAHARLLD